MMDNWISRYKKYFGLTFLIIPMFGAVVNPSRASSATLNSSKYHYVNGDRYSFDDLKERNKASFYDAEKKMFLLEKGAVERIYLKDYFKLQLGKKTKNSTMPIEEVYFQKFVTVSDDEVKQALEYLSASPQFQKIPKEKRLEQVRLYLFDQKKSNLVAEILDSAYKKKQIRLAYKMPQKPVFEIPIGKEDHQRFRYRGDKGKPLKCKGDECKVTVVEYSEFQCPYCSRVLPVADKLMKKYEGRIRWVVKDFPLNIHPQAKPAAVAAKCADRQNQYWGMYEKLFQNQKNLDHASIRKYASELKLGIKKWDRCMADQEKIEKKIDKNYQDALAFGVMGTPTFFVNGVRYEGPLSESGLSEEIEKFLK